MRRATVALLLILVAFFAALELKAPYYFLQDDNRDYSLPLWVGSARALAAGEIGQFNFYQSLGMPLLASGQSGGLTPFSYLAVGTSHALLGHPDAAIDIAVFLYFLIGGLGCLYLAGVLGLSRWAGLFAAVAWCLNPFNVYVSVSWVLMAPLVAFLPWIVGLDLRLYAAPRLRTLVAAAAAHALLFFTGYVPWLMFLAVFEGGLFAILATLDLRRDGDRSRLRRAVGWIAALPAVAAAFAAPLLLPMAHQMSLSAYRSHSATYHAFASQTLKPLVWLNGLLLPFRRLYTVDPYAEWTFLEKGSPAAVTHLGYLTLGLLLLALLRLWRRAPLPGRRAVLLGFAGLAAVAIVWSLGLLSPVLYHVPMFNRLRWPFRLLPFATFFLIWLAGAGLDAWSSSRPDAHRRAALAGLLALHTLNLGAANLLHDQRGFFQHLDPVPLAPPALAGLHQGRAFTMGVFTPIGGRDYTAGSLGFDYAMLWRVFHFAGYETMMPQANWQATDGLNHASPAPVGASFFAPPRDLRLDYLRDWGVRWYLVTEATVPLYAAYLESHGLSLADRDDQRRVYRDDQARPLVFWRDGGTADGLTLSAGANELAVEAASERGGVAVVSFLWNPFFEGTLDGAPLAIGSNSLGQMTVAIPPGRHRARLRYSDPFLRIGVVIALLGGCVLAGVAFLGRRRPSAAASGPR